MKNFLSIMVVGLMLLLGACTAEVVATRPNDVVYARPAAPGPGNVWISGNWVWSGGNYRWHEGYWDHARTGHVWHEGHWEEHGNGWKWKKGHW